MGRYLPRFIKIISVLLLVSVISLHIHYPASAISLDETKTMERGSSGIDYEAYASEGKYFSALIPKKWEKEEKSLPYGDLTKIYGVKLTGLRNKDDAPVTISVLYYSGEGIFMTHEEFIRNKLNSMVRIDYDREAAVTDSVTAGRSAKKFQIKTFELIYLPMHTMPPMPEGRVYEIVPPTKQVNMVQQFIVIPARKGFYVLHYGAPEDIVGEYQGVFEKVIGSFNPRLK